MTIDGRDKTVSTRVTRATRAEPTQAPKFQGPPKNFQDPSDGYILAIRERRGVMKMQALAPKDGWGFKIAQKQCRWLVVMRQERFNCHWR